MDTVLSFLAAGCTLGAIVGVLALAVVGSFALSRRRGRQWAAAAQQLGMTVGDGQGRPSAMEPMWGERAGLPVQVKVFGRTRGSGNNRRTEYFTFVRVTFPRSLDIGLKVSPTGLMSRAWTAVAGESDLQVGDPELDPRFDVRAADPRLAAQLLRVPYVREGLVWHANATFRPHVSDTSVYCEAKGAQRDVGTLSVAVDGAVDLARRVIAARAEIGPSRGQWAVAERWQLVAQSRGLSVDVENTRMSGRYEGMHVEVDTQLRGQQRWTVFTVRFDRPLGVGLVITRQTSLSSLGKLLGMQDIETGDRTFDDRFVIKGNPASTVRSMLGPEVRQRLAALADQATKIEVKDDMLRAEVQWLVVEPQDVESGIATLAGAAAALAGVGPTHAGPFR